MSEIRFAAVGGVTLHYTLDGTNRLNGSPEGPALVFINSLGTDLRIWDKLVPAFAPHFPILRYDKRGHGLSDSPPGPYSITDHTDDLVALLGYIGIKEVILVGISVGGMIALNYAACHPDGVKALILSDTGARIGTAAAWNERIEAVREKGIGHIADIILARWFSKEFAAQHPAEYRGYSNMLVRTPAAGYIATCAAIRDADLREAAGSINANALVMCGAEDGATPPDLGQELAKRLGQARFELIHGAAHLPCIEQPDDMAAAINRFLQENGCV